MKKYLFSLLFLLTACTKPSLDDKIAQMIMVGFNGTELTQDNPIYSDIKDAKIGGVILFNINVDKTKPELKKNIDNPTQLTKLIADLQSISKTPLFVAIDQEGGLVSRLNNSFDVSTLSAKDLGKINNPKTTYDEAYKTAKLLKQMGININFAPCVDVEINPNSIITKRQRIYSKDANDVTTHATEVVKAAIKADILPVIKHFPGHGSPEGDTHEDFVEITDTFQEVELTPYQAILKDYPSIGVLTTHVFNQNIDPEHPLSLSKNSITNLLKNDLQHKGLVFTDDLNMGALAKHYSWQEVLINAINAGSDVLVIGNNLTYNPDVAKQSIATIKQAVIDGKIKQSRIDDAYNKIIKQKGL